MEELTEQELTEVWNAIIQGDYKWDVWIYLHDLELHIDFVIVWGSYKGKSLYFQQREDWGVILHSIIWNNKGDLEFIQECKKCKGGEPNLCS